MYDLDHCKICKRKLPETLREFAHRIIEEITCTRLTCKHKDLVRSFGCCEKAKPSPCVCMYSFTCPIHGDTHIGTHD
jgi:hypothetical protein